MAKKRVCMACDSEVGENDTVCPSCGVDLEFFAVTVEDKKKALDDLLSSVIGDEVSKDSAKAPEPAPETPPQKSGDASIFDLSELEIEEKPPRPAPVPVREEKKPVPPPDKKPEVSAEKKEPKVVVEKVEYVREVTKPKTPAAVPEPPRTPESLTPDKELSLKTAEAKALMTAGTRLEAELSAPRSYIAQGVQFAKKGDIQTALKYLNDAIALLRETNVKKLNELLENIERKIGLLEKHGTNMSRERKMLMEARDCIGRREIIEAVNIYDNLREMLGIAAKPGEKKESADEFERVLTAMERYGLDMRDEKERYERFRYTATPSELEKFKGELLEEMNARIHGEIADLGRVLVEKKYAGANVKNLAAILKQATIAFKRKQYVETLKYLESFRKIASYTSFTQQGKPKAQPEKAREDKPEKPPAEVIKVGDGEVCFLNTNNVKLAYASASEFLKKDRVLIMTTSYPERLKKSHGLEKAVFAYLTDSYSVEARYDIRRLDFEITYEISNFLSEAKGGLIVIDDIELMALYNGIEAVMNFIKTVIDKVMQNSTALLVTADLNTFSKKDAAVFRTLFSKIVDKQEDIAVREVTAGFQPVLGRSYLVETNSTTIDIIRNLIKGRKALIITKNFPKKLREDPRLTDAEIYWFTESEGYENVLRPSRMEFEVLKTILDFMRETHGLVFFDALSNALLSNEFKAVVDFLKAIDDENSISGSTLIVEMTPGGLEKEKTRIIEQRFDEILRY
ncbi:MAG: DUF835 domain-containing protein [Thermoplasmata archaeon]|nr:DUF835 domain-containing protein [Thermoplasmata archaeon]